MELKVDKGRSVILWLEPEQLLNDPPPPITPSSFQISHRPSGLSGQHHVDRRPLVPISTPPFCTVSLSPMVKRPRRVPFHISFGLVSGLGSVFVALPCSTPRWLSATQFPLLWCPKSPLIESGQTATFTADHLLFLGLSRRPTQLQVDGRVSLCTPLRGWICVCSCVSCSYSPKVLSQRKQSPGEMRLLVRSCSCCRCCHHKREEANRKTWLHHYCTGTLSTVWNLDVDEYQSLALWFIDFLLTFQLLLTILTLISSKYSHLRDVSLGHSLYFMMRILTSYNSFLCLSV